MAEEANTQRAIIKYCEQQGWIALKADYSKPGYMDLLIITPYEVLFVEVKAKRGRLSEIQKHRIEELKTMNKKVFVVHSLEEFKNEITPAKRRR